MISGKSIADVFSIYVNDDTIDDMNRTNFRSGIIMSPLIAIFEIVMIIFTIKNISDGGEPVRYSYLYCYIFLLAATLGALTLLICWRQVGRHRRKLVWLAHIYAAIIIAWAVAITYLDLSRGGQLTVYLTIIVVLACAFFIHPIASCIIFGGGTATLMLLVYNSLGHSMDVTINVLVFAVFMFLVSIMRFIGKKASVIREALIVKQNKELNNLNEKLTVLSRTDMLTGLYNRWYYDETVPLIAEQCVSGKLPMTAVLLDIDGFKNINDTYGHKAGDVCISTVAQVIQLHSGRFDGIAYRFGGEEFLVMIPNCDISKAAEMAECIRKDVEARPMGCIEHPVTVSIGCHSSIPDDCSQAEGFVVKADHAMYRAKASGKNTVVLDS